MFSIDDIVYQHAIPFPTAEMLSYCVAGNYEY